jgi:hypothetical protein
VLSIIESGKTQIRQSFKMISDYYPPPTTANLHIRHELCINVYFDTDFARDSDDRQDGLFVE